MSTRFGYIGLGNMGVPIVRNLAKYAAASGFPSISIWNRSSAKYALVKDAIPDAFYADNVEDVVKKSDIVLSSLLDDKAAEDVFGKMFKATEGRNVIFVDQSSLKAVTSGKHLIHEVPFFLGSKINLLCVIKPNLQNKPSLSERLTLLLPFSADLQLLKLLNCSLSFLARPMSNRRSKSI